ncbi:MAG: RNA polymerase sigma factor [Thermocrispum sp.]
MTVQAITLVSALRAGERDAFAHLYSHYSGYLHQYLLSQLRDPVTAEDLTSETFLRALRGARLLSADTVEIRPWLTRIARNLVYDHVKSARHRLEVVVDKPVEDGRSAPDPSYLVLRRRERQWLISGIAQLTGDQQRCVSLRFFGEHTVAETATAMGRDPGAVRALQHRAVRKLASILTGQPAATQRPGSELPSSLALIPSLTKPSSDRRWPCPRPLINVRC